MSIKEQPHFCQIVCLQHMKVNTRPFEFLWQIILRVEWAIYRRIKFIIRSISSKLKARIIIPQRTMNENLSHGDLVRVKTIEEILSTLNSWNELKGCGFMDEMRVFCGSTQKVHKRVDKFIDERDYRVKRAMGLVLLENIFCEGTKIFGKCDRSCFFFWREEWLEKIEPKL
jgi:hypothetical protein